MANKRKIPQTEAKKPKKLTRKGAIIIAIISFFMASTIALVSILSFVPANGYQVEIKQLNDETGARQITSVDIYANVVNGGTYRVDEIWVKLADLKSSEIDVYVSKGTDTDSQATGSTTKLLKKTTFTKSQITKKKGWVMVYKGDGFPVSKRPQIKIGFDKQVTLQEVVVLDTNSKLPALTVTGMSIGEAPTESGTPWSKIDSIKASEDKPLTKNLVKIVDGLETCPYITVKEN